jgi:hypothetical protein
MKVNASKLVLLVPFLFLPVVASAWASERPVPSLVSMGPDPGGRSGEGVTPATTTTDHPAVAGPQSATPSPQRKDESSKDREDESARRDDPSDRAHTAPAREEGSER